MKILVLSDSHRVMYNMERAVLDEQPDYIIHLGDHDTDAQALSETFQQIPLASVSGNCDFYSPLGKEQIIAQWGGVRMLLTHGHRYGVKQGLLRLSLAAREAGVQVALFGHTHMAYCEKIDGLWLVNPGSCGHSRPSYGVIEISDGVPSCCIRRIT